MDLTFLKDPIVLVALFAVSAVVGYLIIRNIPALLHTPLMSGMNALSGVTVLGAIVAVNIADRTGNLFSMIVALFAAFLAIINVAGGFSVTHKMLRSFVKKKEKEDTIHE